MTHIDERMRRLQAAEAHEVSTGIEENEHVREARKVDEYGKPYTLLWIGLQCVYVFDGSIRTHLGIIKSDRHLNRAIALLTRARELMGGV